MPPSVVSSRMGVFTPAPRTVLTTCRPSIPGIILSMTMTSYFSAAARRRPSRPLSATTATWPSCRKPLARYLAVCQSSSTMRIFISHPHLGKRVGCVPAAPSNRLPQLLTRSGQLPCASSAVWSDISLGADARTSAKSPKRPCVSLDLCRSRLGLSRKSNSRACPERLLEQFCCRHAWNLTPDLPAHDVTATSRPGPPLDSWQPLDIDRTIAALGNAVLHRVLLP